MTTKIERRAPRRRHRLASAAATAAIFASAALALASVSSAAATATGGGTGLDAQLQPLHAQGRAAARAADRTREMTRAHAGKADARAGRATAAKATTTSTPIVLLDLEHLEQKKSITTAQYTHYRSVYKQAQSTLSKLTGTRHTELADVLANVTSMASAKELIASRLPLLFLTIERNREWWSDDSLLSYGDRVSFPGSRLVWEYYTGQGIEVQWLGTFGEANGYYLAGDENEALRQVLDEARELVSSRAGGIAWEYMFQFDGGIPPWTSSLSQGTAIQAFSRAASRLQEPAFQKTAEEALGIFQTPPPTGVRVARKVDGKPAAEYMEYSFAPTDRILNGYIQSLNGLYDFTKLTGSQTGLRLFEEGDAEARTQVPKYNTGAWSMYDEYTESDLGYHELLAEFLVDLCSRTREGEPLQSTTTTETTETTTTATAGGGTSGEASTQAQAGGAQASRVSKKDATAKTPIAGDEIYCATAEEFTADIHTAPVLKLLSHKLAANSQAGVMFSLSKISTVSLTVRGKSGKVVWTNSATVEGGTPRLLWETPKGSGTYQITASAVDLAGNTASTSGEVKLTAKGH